VITFVFLQLNFSTVIFFPNAKINIGLNVISKRADGYHNLETLFYPIEWKDVLEIVPAKYNTFTSSGIEIPGSGNLCLKALELVRSAYDFSPVHIHLHKNIPVGAGLGGGSSDAAFTLMGINQLFDLGIDQQQLHLWAKELGADCPFFLYNKPSFASGIGNQLEPIQLSLKDYFLVVVKPPIFISTAQAFSGLKPQKLKSTLKSELFNDMAKWTVKNDFEESIFPIYPELQNIKNQLLDAGAIYASMSGSGSAIYGFFSSKPNLNFDQELVFYQPNY